MSDKSREFEVLDVKISNIEKDVEELKEDNKVNKELLTKNIVKQTTLMEHLSKRMDKNDERVDKQDEKIDSVSEKVTDLHHNLETRNRIIQFIETHSIKIIWVLILVVLMLLGVNIDFSTITKALL